MYSFLATAGISERRHRPSLSRFAAYCLELTPADGVELASTTTELPEIRGGWSFVRPRQTPRRPLIDEYVDGEVAALVFGATSSRESAATAVVNAFRRGGIEAIRALEGCFSAVVADRRAQSLWIVSDELGLRALRYVQENRNGTTEGICISPHDVLLAAATDRNVDLDLVSAASIIAVDWSLLGRPLLRNVTQCRPFSSVCFRSGGLDEHPHSPFGAGVRLDPADRTGIEDGIERVGEALEESTRSFVQQVRESGRPLETTLTAGMDSRALLALFLSVVRPSELTAFTSGSAEGQEVRVAARLCGWTGVRHQYAMPDEPSSDEFKHNADLRAFFCNGETNAKRALQHRERFDPEKAPRANGGGGEVFRGFFYPYFGPLGKVPDSVSDIQKRLIAWRFRRLHKLPFADPDILRGIETRLAETLQGFAEISRDGHDIVDLFYVYERYGRWGGAHARLVWGLGWTPFDSVRAIREAYRLPAPIGKNCPIQARLVRRHLPTLAYLMPINGGQLLAFEGRGDLRYLVRQVASIQAKALERLQTKFSKTEQTHEQRRARLFAGPLREFVRDSLTERSSISVQLLGERGVLALLDEHEWRLNQLEVLGSLLTLEQWRHLIARARSAAADSTTKPAPNSNL